MKLAPALPATLAAALLSACSSVSVRDYQQTAAVKKPAHIYVAAFDTSSGAFKIAGDKSGATAPAFKQNVSKILTDYTVENISKHVAPATKVATAAAPRDGWLVAGRFTRVNTGSRGLRMFIGLGAGGSKMETAVDVFDASRAKPFMHFATSGGSNAMPGLVTSGGPGVGAAYSMIYQAHNGVTDDAARTSRMIAGALSEYFGERGWIAKDKVFKIKKPGEYQLVHGM
ncbi:MAG TPA: DUF4410 domain-containing protein [Chthoniobacteraceae bacterium]|nr:DUF4410 domain-containing protein [Chthoniobacteraceae bacterium]